MDRPRLYRDQLHGQIRLVRSDAITHTDSEADLGYLVPRIREIPAFQRLRAIRQNGLTNFVFACIEHSRFVHSMGVFHLARSMYDTVSFNSGLAIEPDRRTAVAISGLLHDIGHGPFSHTLEEALTFKNQKPFKHEELTVRYILEYDPIQALLAQYDSKFPERVIAYVTDKEATGDHWTYRLISSQLDADRIDYMLRDASMAGIKGHGFDLERLLDTLTVHEDLRIAADVSSIEAVEAYLLMNMHLYQILYFHKGVRGAHYLLISLIRRCFDLLRDGRDDHLAGIPLSLQNALRQLLERGSGIDLGLYSAIGEHQFWSAFNEWTSHGDRILSDLARRLCARQPFRAIDVNTQKNPAIVWKTIECAKDTMAGHLGISADEVTTYYLGVDDPSRQGYKEHRFLPGERSVDEAIWIRMRDGSCVPVENLRDNHVLMAMLHRMHFNRIVFPAEFRELVTDCMN